MPKSSGDKSLQSDSLLDSLRVEIDQIDIQLQELIVNRVRAGQQIADIKRQQSERPQYFVPEREAQILSGVKARNDDSEVPDEFLVQIFREVISVTRAMEKTIRVAILGPKGTFTSEAAIKHFGRQIDTSFQPTINDVFAAVEASRADFGVVPVENSSEGVVANTLNCIAESPSRLCGEIEMRIHHNLLSSSDDISTIRTVLAHQQGIAQCRRWLARNLPNAKTVTVSSNSEAVLQARGDESMAAIASKTAAGLYEMNILREHIEDQSRNTTRFLIIGNIETKPTGNDKTSILISQQNRPGSLIELLKPIAEHNVSMTKIESRPSRLSLWDYVFFIDLEGHEQDKNIVALLRELKELATLFKVLGSYPRSSN